MDEFFGIPLSDLDGPRLAFVVRATHEIDHPDAPWPASLVDFALAQEMASKQIEGKLARMIVAWIEAYESKLQEVYEARRDLEVMRQSFEAEKRNHEWASSALEEAYRAQGRLLELVLDMGERPGWPDEVNAALDAFNQDGGGNKIGATKTFRDRIGKGLSLKQAKVFVEKLTGS